MGLPDPGAAVAAEAALRLWLIATGIVGRVVGVVTDRHNHAIRCVLGPHEFGSSDPATWTRDLLKCVAGPQSYGAQSYTAAVPLLLDTGEFARAMWTARLAVALENRAEGEQLTDSVLRNAQVQQALKAVRRDPFAWSRVMKPGQEMPGDRNLPDHPCGNRPERAGPREPDIPLNKGPCKGPVTKPCPRCGAELGVYAVKCRFCKAEIEGKDQ
jgi:hypothetical protein